MQNLHDLVSGIASAMEIAREGSFRGAARSSGLGFRTLQHQIKTLEERLGFIIFHRTPDGVVPTSEGKVVLEEAQQIEQALTKILRLGKSLNNQAEGEVMLATTEGLGTFWISPRLHEFNRIHPKISIRLHPSMTLADMRRFEIDLALQVVEPILPEIKRVRIGTLHLMLAAAPSYIAKHGEPKTIEELKDHTFVFHTSPQSSDRLLIEQSVGSKLAQSQFIVMRNSSAHYMTLEHGLGIGFIPSYGFGIDVKLVPLNVPVRHSLDIWLCFHADARGTPRIATVIDWLSSVFDPRLYPWFRRDFVDPREFDAIIDSNGTKDIIKSLSLAR
ncbi:MAG: LysR family transcriptional regulator [Beijerinckiaceae bacterium]